MHLPTSECLQYFGTEERRMKRNEFAGRVLSLLVPNIFVLCCYLHFHSFEIEILYILRCVLKVKSLYSLSSNSQVYFVREFHPTEFCSRDIDLQVFPTICSVKVITFISISLKETFDNNRTKNSKIFLVSFHFNEMNFTSFHSSDRNKNSNIQDKIIHK